MAIAIADATFYTVFRHSNPFNAIASLLYFWRDLDWHIAIPNHLLSFRLPSPSLGEGLGVRGVLESDRIAIDAAEDAVDRTSTFVVAVLFSQQDSFTLRSTKSRALTSFWLLFPNLLGSGLLAIWIGVDATEDAVYQASAFVVAIFFRQ
jgi:hypothetical protein